MSRLTVILMMLLSSLAMNAQEWKTDWDFMARLGGSSGQYMPFWARTGGDGILPVRSSGLLTLEADARYEDTDGMFFETGFKLAGAVAMRSPLNTRNLYGMMDRLYVSGGWKMIRLDLGMVPRHGELGDLSVTGGDIILSCNARNLPGVNLSSDWIYFEKGHWFGIRGNLAHYVMSDNRYVKGTLIHNKSLAGKVSLGRKVDVMGGLNHFVQWGGTAQGLEGAQQQSLGAFFKILFGMKGDRHSSVSDQNNALGNHLGNEWMRIVWRADRFTLTAQYDKPFEDNSGKNFQNFPDGVWTLQLGLKDRKAFLTDITYEFINTTWQSGPAHDRPATEEEKAEQDVNDYYYGKIVLGGCDNYFNNGPYRSGWTYYGRMIGLPLCIPAAPVEAGYTMGILNNRIRGHHIGVKGVVAERIPYRFKATFTENFGKYHQTETSFFASRPWQLSLALETDITGDLTGLPLLFSIGVYGDVGKVYQNSVGLTFRISRF